MTDRTEYQALIAWIQERATTHNDCWNWKLALAHGTHPQGRYLGKCINVRRTLVETRMGRKLKNNQVCLTSCGNPFCVRPEHVAVKSRAVLQKGVKRTLAARKNIAEGIRRSHIKYSDEVIALAREMEGSGRAIARVLGMSKDYVNQLRRGVVRQDYTPSPFAALANTLCKPARAATT